MSPPEILIKCIWVDLGGFVFSSILNGSDSESLFEKQINEQNSTLDSEFNIVSATLQGP